MHALLHALAAFGPHRPALVDDQGALAAADVQRLALEEAHWLATRGVDRLGLLAGNGRGWAISDLALTAGGRVGVPLPAHFGGAQLAHALNGAGVAGVLTDEPERILGLGLGFAPSASSPRTGLVLLVRAVAALPPLPAGTARITYTSGSTAEPKGVCLSEATLAAVARSVGAIAGERGVSRHLALLPLATLLENVAGLHGAWLAGATCHLPSAVPAAIARGALEPAALLAAVTAHDAQSLILVPELLRILVAGAESGWKPPAAARFFAVGGARVSPLLLERAAAAGLPVHEGYGLSECGSVVSLNRPGGERRGSVGRVLPHARVRIGERGEIHVAGALMAGYVGDTGEPPAEIATGDCGELDADGYLYVKGRLKNVFITSYGRNLSPEWIESELSQENAIGQAVVFGEARAHVVALVAPAHPRVSAGAIAGAIARANSRLPAYARVARYQLMDEPLSAVNGLLTANGRPRRPAIEARYGPVIERLHEETTHAAV